ncbi:DUF5806 family protein [Salinirubrum litoreum]|uniref:DUF5806 family protein n=1 Tax=Salinirubrum litoreum TaxID=1126234 RepID=A0ABD5R640_9EURY|nr:DUF5806 family protein [Salinirubrum litoreum]
MADDPATTPESGDEEATETATDEAATRTPTDDDTPHTSGASESPAGDDASDQSAEHESGTESGDDQYVDAEDMAPQESSDLADEAVSAEDAAADVPADVQKYARFQKMDGAQYDRVNEFLRDRTYITAREWAIARLCADFRTETGVEMTKIGENLPRLIPFMTDTYTPQAVNQARHSFEEKVTKAGATFLYGAMSGFFTAEELDETMYEVSEVAKFLLEVEGVDLSVGDELEAEERISSVMREVRQSSAELRGEEVQCPECGHVHES